MGDTCPTLSAAPRVLRRLEDEAVEFSAALFALASPAAFEVGLEDGAVHELATRTCYWRPQSGLRFEHPKRSKAIDYIPPSTQVHRCASQAAHFRYYFSPTPAASRFMMCHGRREVIGLRVF
jgi:hypothetical protein